MAAEDAPDAGVLPDCAAVIFDEAHELEEVASELLRDQRQQSARSTTSHAT